MTIKRLFGSAPNQVSRNKDLGTMAFQDHTSFMKLIDYRNSGGPTVSQDIGANVPIATLDLQKYSQFHVTYKLRVTSTGGMHVYIPFFDKAGNQLTMGGRLDGYNTSGSANTPFSSTGDVWPRVAFDAQEATTVYTQFWIYSTDGINGVTYEPSVNIQTSWYYRGVGFAWASGMLRANGTSIASMAVNADSTTSSGTTGIWECCVYGMGPGR